MSDPGIKLFGRTIQLPETLAAEPGAKDNEKGCFRRMPQTFELVEARSSKPSYGPFAGNSDVQASKTEEQIDPGVSQEKSFRKPERVLTCPRCNSVDTKFCYYNNYNTNQPRHFCKNCQRYWTAGGTMRNVPVGAGRRKNKSAAVGQLRPAVPEALPKVSVEHSTGVHHHPGPNTNATALKLSSDAPPLCNVFSRTGEQESCVSLGSKECGHDPSTGSSIASPNDVIGKRRLQEQVSSCHPFPSWPYPCHSAQWHSLASAPTFAFGSVPMPSSYSSATQLMGSKIPSLWTGPWVSPPAPMAPWSGASSMTLGKHSRDDITANFGEEIPSKNTLEQRLCVPKASKLGIEEDGADSVGICSSSLLKSFKGESENKGALHMKSSSVLQANTAALSVALSFRESS